MAEQIVRCPYYVPAAAYTTKEVVRILQGLHEQAVQLADRRWMLKRLLL
jgi:hypothetical protein